MHHIVNDIMKENAPRISVIVPIYNVEPYVRQCLDSLKNQTMKEIEIICIDDGSTDRSGEIADEYASATSPVFRVMHTENRGLSAARNRGIMESRAPWLMFVDSDDWVDENFCGTPYRVAIEHTADIVIFGAYRTTEDGKIKKNKNKATKSGLVSREVAIDISREAVWTKLYKKELFQDIRYPEGRAYEDVGTTHLLIYQASRIISISKKLYYYRYRTGSICHRTSSDRDRILLGMKRYDELVQLGYPAEKAEIFLIGAALRYCGRADIKNDELYKKSAEILRKKTGIPSRLSRKEKIMMVIWKVNENLYRGAYRLLIKDQIYQ